jgi:hypothetical protein
MSKETQVRLSDHQRTGGIRKALGNELNTNMPKNSTVKIAEAEELTNAYNAKRKATKENRKCTALYAITLKQMKLLRLLTKANTETWPGSEA